MELKKHWIIGAAVVAGGAVALVAALSLASAGHDDKRDTALVANATAVAGSTATVGPTRPALTVTQVPQVSPPASTPQVNVPVPPPLDTAVTPTPTLPPGTQAVLAPIEKLDVLTRESPRSQYSVTVKAGLPSGCAKSYSSSATRNGDTFLVQVQNTLPISNAPCTAIYGRYDVIVTLPGPFVSGTTYTVVANGTTTTTFTAQ